MLVHDLAIAEIMALGSCIEGIEIRNLFSLTASSIEIDLLAFPAINSVVFYSALRKLGLKPAIEQHKDLEDGEHEIKLRIHVAPSWKPTH